MHSESLEIHAIAIPLFEQNNNPDTLEFEMKHQRIIEHFGRYPDLNAVLKRLSTEAVVSLFATAQRGVLTPLHLILLVGSALLMKVGFALFVDDFGKGHSESQGNQHLNIVVQQHLHSVMHLLNRITCPVVSLYQ